MHSGRLAPNNVLFKIDAPPEGGIKKSGKYYLISLDLKSLKGLSTHINQKINTFQKFLFPVFQNCFHFG